MNAKKFIAAAAVFVAAASAFAADGAAVDTTAAASAVVATADTSSRLNVPTVSITKTITRGRSEVRAEAVDFVKNYKTAFAVQLEQYKN
jgi:hypothetical protein